MPKHSSRRWTEQESAERRRQDRDRLQQAARELLNSAGWARWVRTRAMFHSYSVFILSRRSHRHAARGLCVADMSSTRSGCEWLVLAVLLTQLLNAAEGGRMAAIGVF
jgi:hypothetical protein